jgi:hypothetical protein
MHRIFGTVCTLGLSYFHLWSQPRIYMRRTLVHFESSITTDINPPHFPRHREPSISNVCFVFAQFRSSLNVVDDYSKLEQVLSDVETFQRLLRWCLYLNDNNTKFREFLLLYNERNETTERIAHRRKPCRNRSNMRWITIVHHEMICRAKCATFFEVRTDCKFTGVRRHLLVAA